MSEVEERIARIKNHKGVKGLLIVDGEGKFIRSTMSTQPGELAPKIIAQKVSELAKKARSIVRDINPLDDLTFFRVRSKKQEILVAPDKEYFLIVVQQPNEELD